MTLPRNNEVRNQVVRLHPARRRLCCLYNVSLDELNRIWVGSAIKLTCLHTDETRIHVERHTIDETGAEETAQKDQIGPSCIDIGVEALSYLGLWMQFLERVSRCFAVCVHSGELNVRDILTVSSRLQ